MELEMNMEISIITKQETRFLTSINPFAPAS